jgi:hypothetical protein
MVQTHNSMWCFGKSQWTLKNYEQFSYSMSTLFQIVIFNLVSIIPSKLWLPSKSRYLGKILCLMNYQFIFKILKNLIEDGCLLFHQTLQQHMVNVRKWYINIPRPSSFNIWWSRLFWGGLFLTCFQQPKSCQLVG